MDTQPNQYANILKALGTPQTNDPTQSKGGLSMVQQAENYSAFDELMRSGVHIPTLLKRLDEMESKIKTLESQPKQDTNAELLAVMEQAVKNDPDVKKSRQHVADVKSAIITELCMQDQRYRDALEAYKTMVNKVYIQTRERDGRTERTPRPEIQAETGGGAAEIRHDPGRSGEDQEGLSSGQKTE